MNKSTVVKRIKGPDTRLIDIHTHVGADMALFSNGDFPYALSAEDMLIRNDRWSVDHTVCFPFLYTRYFNLAAFRRGVFRASGDPSCPCPYAFENERLAVEIYEAFPKCAGRLLPFAFFDPARKQKEQVAFLSDLMDRYPFFGLKTATSYQHSFITDLLKKKGECLLDFAAARDLPFMIHTAVLPGDPWANVFEILKVVEARPENRFCLAHTCRFDRKALDRAAELPNCFVDFSAFHIHCKLANEGHEAVAKGKARFPAPYRQHAAAMQKFAATYPDTMLWGSDTPAYYFMARFTNDKGELITMKLSCDTDTEINEFRKLPAATRKRIGRQNNLRYLFGDKAK